MNKISVEEWLANLDPEIRTITTQLRAVARKNMPKAHEFMYHDVIDYSTNDSSAVWVCYISPQKKGYVNFGFFFGAGLPDTNNLLMGEGKRMRHVKVWNVEEAKNPALAKLIAMAWKTVPESIAKILEGRKKIKRK